MLGGFLELSKQANCVQGVWNLFVNNFYVIYTALLLLPPSDLAAGGGHEQTIKRNSKAHFFGAPCSVHLDDEHDILKD